MADKTQSCELRFKYNCNLPLVERLMLWHGFNIPCRENASGTTSPYLSHILMMTGSTKLERETVDDLECLFRWPFRQICRWFLSQPADMTPSTINMLMNAGRLIPCAVPTAAKFAI